VIDGTEVWVGQQPSIKRTMTQSNRSSGFGISFRLAFDLNFILQLWRCIEQDRVQAVAGPEMNALSLARTHIFSGPNTLSIPEPMECPEFEPPFSTACAVTCRRFAEMRQCYSLAGPSQGCLDYSDQPQGRNCV